MVVVVSITQFTRPHTPHLSQVEVFILKLGDVRRLFLQLLCNVPWHVLLAQQRRVHDILFVVHFVFIWRTAVVIIRRQRPCDEALVGAEKVNSRSVTVGAIPFCTVGCAVDIAVWLMIMCMACVGSVFIKTQRANATGPTHH